MQQQVKTADDVTLHEDYTVLRSMDYMPIRFNAGTAHPEL